MLVLKPAPLSTNNIYKVVRFGNRGGIMMSAEGKSLKELYQWQAKSQWKSPLLKGDLRVEAHIFYRDKRKRDIDNGNKILFDSLTGIVFDDDSQIQQLYLVKSYDKQDPRVEISVYEI